MRSTIFRAAFLGLVLGVAFTAWVVGSASLQVWASQGKQAKLQYGAVYSCPERNNYQFKVLSCDPNDWCQVFTVNKYSPGGGNVAGQGKDTILSLIKNYGCQAEGGEPANENTKTEATPEPIQEQGQEQASGECASEEILKATAKPGDSIELKSKRAILAFYQKRVEEGEYRAVGVSFESFQVGPPRANLRGSTLYIESAPLGAKIYPVKSNHTVCRRYDREIKRDVLDGRLECFKDNFGEWDCATASGNRTISTKYEKAPKWKS